MPIITVLNHVEFQQPFVRFMRLNGVAIPAVDVIPLTRTNVNTFSVSVNPAGQVSFKVFLAADGITVAFDGGTTATPRVVHQLVIPPMTLNPVTDYLIRVESAVDPNVICELDLKTNP